MREREGKRDEGEREVILQRNDLVFFVMKFPAVLKWFFGLSLPCPDTRKKPRQTTESVGALFKQCPPEEQRDHANSA